MNQPVKNLLIAGAILCVTLFTSCLKNGDNLTSKSVQVALINYAVNSGNVTLNLDDDNLTPTPVTFPGVTGNSAAIYLSAHAGTRQLRLSNASTTLFDKNYTFDAGKLYSVFLYDSIRNNTAGVFILPDDTTSIDTLGRLRFLHLLPGRDTISMSAVSTFRADTLVRNVFYAGSVTDAFPITEKPGIYSIKVFSASKVLLANVSVEIRQRDVLSFVLHPTVTGAPALTVLRHRY